MTTPAPTTPVDPQVFADYLVRTRWFGGKGRPFEVTGITRLGGLGGQDPRVDVLAVSLRYSDVGEALEAAEEIYQVPLAYYTDPEHRLDHAFIGWWEDPDDGWLHAYDAVHDHRAAARWLAAFAPGVEADGLRFHRVPGFEPDLGETGTLFAGEQSNSSIAFGEDSLLKLFRKITPGPNPDITTHEVLTRAESPHVAQLYGWVEHGEGDDVLHLGMLSQFLRTATDGWDLATTSARDLFADPERAARDAGGDFASEAGRLGEALREVHDVLASQGESRLDAAELAAQMRRRLDVACDVVPELAGHAPALRALFSEVADLGEIVAQPIHGDLHLGQTLRTSLGWKIVDFEGEPAKPLAERLLPDSRWRDVAGMLRSFDYAARVVERQLDPGEHSDTDLAQVDEWVSRNQRAFIGGYRGQHTDDHDTESQRSGDQDTTLLRAYAADKAVYEVVYETRNRPIWVDIPLAAIARIGAA